MSRSNVKSSSGNKFRDFTSNSLFLIQREDLINKSLLLNSDFDYRWSLSCKKPLDKKFESLRTKTWTKDFLVREFKLHNFSEVWEKIWDKQFIYPTSYLFSHTFSKPKSQLSYSTFSQNLVNFGLKKNNLYKEHQLSWAKEYIHLIDANEIQQEIFLRQKKLEEENLTTELVKLDLIKQYEELNNKFTSPSLKLEGIEIKKEEPISATVEWKPDFLSSAKLGFKLPLINSLPSMFLSYFRSKEFSINSSEPLKDIPQWLRKINYVFNRWSIAKYIPEERAKVLSGPVNFSSLNKDNIQWHDPEEKWFYYYLPLINLFFDRFRERYKKSIVTTWEEPEYTFPITSIDISEEFDFSIAQARPVFMYEGIPRMKIGGDLELIESIIKIYGSHYEEQSKKELSEEGLAPVQLSESIDSSDLLNKFEKERESV